jgi:hypothetical protein
VKLQWQLPIELAKAIEALAEKAFRQGVSMMNAPTKGEYIGKPPENRRNFRFPPRL